MNETPPKSEGEKKSLPPEFFKLSKYQKIHLLITFLGVLVATFAFIRVGDQVQNLSAQTQRQTEAINLQRIAIEAQIWQSIAAQQIELSKVMISNADLRPYLADGKSISREDKNFNRVMAIAEMHLDFIDGFDDMYVRSLHGMEENGKYWILWERYFKDIFASSPALCIRYSELADSYTKAVGKYASAGCKNVSREASNPAVHTDAAR